MSSILNPWVISGIKPLIQILIKKIVLGHNNNIPRVLRLFVNFLLRRKVLPQIKCELCRSLEVITLAIIELAPVMAIGGLQRQQEEEDRRAGARTSE
jgi:hypothetical protein